MRLNRNQSDEMLSETTNYSWLEAKLAETTFITPVLWSVGFKKADTELKNCSATLGVIN